MSKLKWWGYVHTNGEFQVKRFFNQEDFAEYGNVGTDFEYITQEGFGWMNASYQYGLSLLHNSYREKLNNLMPPEALF